MRIKELKAELIKMASALPSPSLEAAIIIEKATGLDRIHQIMNADNAVSDSDRDNCFSMIKRRLNGTPMAYITGEKEFYGLTFQVTPATLIPRPDTETIVDKAIEIAREFYKEPKILDLCTGSGAIATAISVALGIPVAFSDISEEALFVAEDNYERLTGRKGDARSGSLFEPWKNQRFDMIVTNPPYLTEEWWEETEIDVKSEPRLALISDSTDGLDIIRRIIDESNDHLESNGFLLIEGDYRQMDICAKILSTAGFGSVSIIKDLAGKERVVYGRREH